MDSLSATGTSAIEKVRLGGVDGQFCDVECEALPCPDASVDCVLFSDVIEHLVNSPKRVLTEFRRVLKPGGACVASTPNATRLTVRLKIALGLSNWANLDGYWDQERHVSHHHEYTAAEFRSVFERVGFDIAEFIMCEVLDEVQIRGLSDPRTQLRTSARPDLVCNGGEARSLRVHEPRAVSSRANADCGKEA